VAGYSIASLARPLLAFAQTWTQVLAIRLTDRIGKGIRAAPRDAMIADAVRVEQRGIAFGFHRAMDHAGAVIGPIVGYLLVVFFVANANFPTTGEFSRIFLAASVPALIAVLVAIFLMRESPVHSI
jgi:MFS family permease